MNKEKEIGEVFRESLQGYKAEPPAGLWDAIAQDKTLLRFNRRHRIARIAKFAAVPVVATVAIVIALLLSTGKSDDTLAVAPGKVINSTSVTTPSPATTPAVETTQPSASAPQQSQTPDGIIVSQAADNQKETNKEAVTHPESVSSPVEPVKPMDIASYNPKNNQENTRIEENEGVSLGYMSMPHYIQPEPKSDRAGQLLWSHDTTVCRNSKLTLFVQNAVDVHWNIGWQGEAVTIFPEEPLVVAATITTYDKIDTTVYIHIGVVDCGLWIPTAFTPNGDGLNDEFLVHAPADINRYECTIYDRTRGLLFRSQNPLQGWDGTFNGKPLPFGSYFYIITYYDALGEKHVEKGQITLIR